MRRSTMRAQRFGRALRAAALGALPALAWLTFATPAPAEETIRMTLHPLTGDEVLYRGDRTSRAADGRVTVTTAYRTPDGRAVQEVESVYEEATLAPVSHRQVDTRSGEEETLARQGDTVRMSYRESAQAQSKEGSVDWRPDMHFVATVASLIAREWERLRTGGTVEFRLLVPSRQDVFQFRLRRDEERSARASGRMVVRMEPGNWLVRRLVDPIYMALEDDPPHRLREWRGRVSIKTDAGEPQDLRIEYTYDGS